MKLSSISYRSGAYARYMICAAFLVVALFVITAITEARVPRLGARTHRTGGVVVEPASQACFIGAFRG